MTDTLPEDGPATLLGVKFQANITDNDDDDRLGPIVAAVNAQVRALPIASQALGEDAWPAGIVLGANMLAVRLWKRKNSPAGVEAFGADGAIYVRRNDPDIAMLLGLGDWSKPAVG